MMLSMKTIFIYIISMIMMIETVVFSKADKSTVYRQLLVLGRRHRGGGGRGKHSHDSSLPSDGNGDNQPGTGASRPFKDIIIGTTGPSVTLPEGMNGNGNGPSSGPDIGNGNIDNIQPGPGIGNGDIDVGVLVPGTGNGNGAGIGPGSNFLQPGLSQSEQVNRATAAVLALVPGRAVCTGREAAHWLRAAFHDAGTFVASTGVGGADGSLAFEQGLDKQTGMGVIITNSVLRSTLSSADTIQLASAAVIPRCGGPDIPFQAGRSDAPAGTINDVSKLPTPFMTVDELRVRFQEMGLDEIDMLVLTTGSHTLGGATRGITIPQLDIFRLNPTAPFIPFDDTPDVFDNHIWKAVLQGRCVLPIDCALAADPQLAPLARKWATDQNAFFQQYVASYKKMSILGANPSQLSNFMDLKVSRVGLRTP